MLPGVIKSLAAFGFFALGLSGCAATSGSQPARLGLKLAPATLGASISLQQHLTVERNGRVDELDAALEVDPQGLELVDPLPTPWNEDFDPFAFKVIDKSISILCFNFVVLKYVERTSFR